MRVQGVGTPLALSHEGVAMSALAGDPGGVGFSYRLRRQMEPIEDEGSGFAESPGLDPGRFVAVLRSEWRLFLLVAVLVLGAAGAFVGTAPRLYSASASIVLETPRKADGPGAPAFPAPADAATVDTEVELLQSRDMAERVVTALALEGDRRFWSGSRSKAPADVSARRDAAVAMVLQGLRVRRAGPTAVVAISVTSPSARLAAEIANAYAAQCLVAQDQAQLASTRRAGQSLSDKLDVLRRQALADAATLAQFRTGHSLYTDADAALGEQEATAYREQLAQAQAEASGDQARLTVARQQLAGEDGGGAAKGVAVDSPVLQALRGQRSQLSVQIAELENRYGDRYPDVVAAHRQLGDVDAGIAAEVGRAVSELQTHSEVSGERVRSLQAALGAAGGRLAGGVAASVTLGDLQRRADGSRQVYEDYLARYQQASASAGTEQPNARIANLAGTPARPSSPAIALDLALGLVAALGAGLGAVFGREAIRPGMSSGEDVERLFGLVFLGSVPEFGSVVARRDRGRSPPDQVVSQPSSAFAEAVRGLRTSLALPREAAAARGRVLAVTSALPGEGKTVTAICLARSASRAGVRVVLVDCDLRRGAVGRLLGLAPAVGLAEVLSGLAALPAAILSDEASGASILPLAASAGSASPEAGFETAAMDRLLQDLSGRFDLVLLDTAPVLAVAETRVLAAKADAVMVLARWRSTPRKALEATLRLLGIVDAPVVGVALTRVNMRRTPRYDGRAIGSYPAAARAYYKAG